MRSVSNTLYDSLLHPVPLFSRRAVCHSHATQRTQSRHGGMVCVCVSTESAERELSALRHSGQLSGVQPTVQPSESGARNPVNRALNSIAFLEGNSRGRGSSAFPVNCPVNRVVTNLHRGVARHTHIKLSATHFFPVSIRFRWLFKGYFTGLRGITIGCLNTVNGAIQCAIQVPIE